jgi:hypothetical protein
MTSQLDTEHENQHGLSELVTGILDDAQEVIKQEFKLVKVEMIDTAKHYSIGAALLLVSIGVLAIAVVLFAFAAAYCMVSQWPALPLWGAFTIVGALAVIMAAVLALIARAQFTEFNPSTSKTEGLKETTQWTTKK